MSVEQIEQISVEDSIRQAITEVEDKETDDVAPDEPDDKPEQEPQKEKARDETGKFAKKAEKTEKEAPEAPELEQKAVAPVEAAPQAWTGAVKSKWAKLDPDVRAEINKREADVHKMMTAHDGELRMGREMKDVITPYMPIITAEGGTPVAAVQSLLNTAYQLRTAPQAQKVALIQQIAQQYGIDLSQAQQPQQQVDPYIRQLEQRVQNLDSQFTQQKTLQEQQEQVKIQSEIQAFAGDPKNTYFEQVKAAMAPLLGNNVAKDLQEAYDMACWANPTIRSTLIAAQTQQEQEKRKAELVKKKQAAVSITGSPSVNTPSSTNQTKSVEDSVREAFDDIVGSKI